jgi:hypothetical protein
MAANTIPGDGAEVGRGPVERALALWRRVELPVGLVVVAAGFVVVFFGWLDASRTADVRRQMQSLISGGFGGLGLVLVGGMLVQAEVASRSARRLERSLDRVGDVLLDLASERPAPEPSDIEAASGTVVATHASFHQPACDLLAGRDGTRSLPAADALREGLRPCPVCLG